MAIVAGDIKWYLSGGASNDDPDASLGGVISNTEIVDASSENIFDQVSGAETEAGDTEYRCIYVKNTNADTTLQNAKVWISSLTIPSDEHLTIGLDDAPETVADENTAPSGVTFSAPTTFAGGLDLGNLAAGGSKAIWLKRIVDEGAGAANVSFTLSVKGETGA